jgi:hypothetical protein
MELLKFLLAFQIHPEYAASTSTDPSIHHHFIFIRCGHYFLFTSLLILRAGSGTGSEIGTRWMEKRRAFAVLISKPLYPLLAFWGTSSGVSTLGESG